MPVKYDIYQLYNGVMWKRVLFVGWLLLVSLWYVTLATKAPFFYDEYLFISKTYYYDLFFKKHDLNDERWYSVGEPAQVKLGIYIFGLTLHVAGVADIEESLAQTSFTTTSDDENPWWKVWKNRDPTSFPPELKPKMELVWAGRITAVVFAVAVLVVIGRLGWQVKRPIWGVVSTVILSTNILMTTVGRQVLTDTMMMFGLYVCLWLLINLTEAITAREFKKILVLSALIGLGIFFATGVKVIGILSLVICAVTLLAKAILDWRKSGSLGRIAASFGVILIFFGGPFIYFQPFLRRDTVTNLNQMFRLRLRDSNIPWSTDPEWAVRTPGEGLALIYKKVLGPGAIYGNFHAPILPVDLLMYAVGLIILAKEAIWGIRQKKEINWQFILGTWNLIVFGALIVYLKNDYYRYYLPLVSSMTLTQVYVFTKVPALRRLL